MTLTPATDGLPCGCPEDRSLSLSRRTLFRIAGVAGLTTATTVSEARFAFGAPATNADVLVVVSLRGGFDGLSAVAPVGDPGLKAKRPNLALEGGAAKQVDSMFGLHPGLEPLYELWDAGRVAAVHAVGQKTVTRSHFAAMEEMERAAPSSSLRTGWIDRALGVSKAPGAFGATQFGSPNLPASLVGPNPKFAMSRIKSVKLAIGDDLVPLGRWQSVMTDLHQGAAPAVSKPMAAAMKAVGTMKPLAAVESDHRALGYPEGQFGEALHDVARMIKADLGLRVATVELGDWDMHAGQGRPDGGWMRDRLTDLSTGLAAFGKELGTDLDRVTLLTLSEFGRRVEENGSGGTDHGHGNAVLVMGGGIKGGKVYGKWPGLGEADLVDGDLAGTTDYRSIVSEVLTKRCGLGSTSEIFPGFKPASLGLVTARA